MSVFVAEVLLSNGATEASCFPVTVSQFMIVRITVRIISCENTFRDGLIVCGSAYMFVS